MTKAPEGIRRLPAVSLPRILDLFWGLGAVVLLMGLAGLWLTQQAENRLTDQILPYALAVHLRAEFYAYDGALNREVGLLPQDQSLRRSTRAAVIQEGAILSREVATVTHTAPSPALHREARAVAHQWTVYRHYASTVLHLLAAGQLVRAQRLQDVGNDAVSTAVLTAVEALRRTDRRQLTTLRQPQHERGNALLIVFAGFAALLSGVAVALRSHVHRNVGALSDALGRMAQGNLEIVPLASSLTEFRLLGKRRPPRLLKSKGHSPNGIASSPSRKTRFASEPKRSFGTGRRWNSCSP